MTRFWSAAALSGEARAVSTTLGYVLSLTVTTILISGLIIAGGSLVDSQRKQTVREELQVVGQQVAADLTAADRLSRTTTDGELRLTRTLPRRVTGSAYVVEISNTGTRYELELATRQPDITVTVGFVSETPVDVGSSITGGDIVIRMVDTDADGVNDTLEVAND